MNERDFQKAAIALAYGLVEKRNAFVAWERYGDRADEVWDAKVDNDLFDAYLKKIRMTEALEEDLLEIAGAERLEK